MNFDVPGCEQKQPLFRLKHSSLRIYPFYGSPGVEAVDFSIERSVAVLDFDPAQSHIDDFLRAVLKAGFKVL